MLTLRCAEAREFDPRPGQLDEIFIRPGDWNGFPSSEYAFPSSSSSTFSLAFPVIWGRRYGC